MFTVGSTSSCNHAEKHLLLTLPATWCRQNSRTNDGQMIKGPPAASDDQALDL
jgi:hypothetical protein